MTSLAFFLFLSALLTAFVVTALARRYADRLGLMDAPGHRKVHATATPRNGGIGIFWGIALPLLAALAAVWTTSERVGSMWHLSRMDGWLYRHGLRLNRATERWFMDFWQMVHQHLPGLKAHAPLAALLLGCTFATHLLGLLDDRRNLPPWPKLLGQLAIASALVCGGELLAPGAFRVLTLFDALFPGGFLLSAILSILWITLLTNAFNFLDNMDGLAAGVAFIAALMFLLTAYLAGQWFICGLLMLFMGSVLGFLCFNFPPASIFMGDGGSMVLGFFLSALTIRITYAAPLSRGPHAWYLLLIPLVIMAVPLYDLFIVSVLRIARGRSPMTGDTNHFSHRLVRQGFSKRTAVLIIYAVTFALGLSAPLLAIVTSPLAILLIGLQIVSLLIVLAILEQIGEHTT